MGTEAKCLTLKIDCTSQNKSMGDDSTSGNESNGLTLENDSTSGNESNGLTTGKEKYGFLWEIYNSNSLSLT